MTHISVNMKSGRAARMLRALAMVAVAGSCGAALASDPPAAAPARAATPAPAAAPAAPAAEVAATAPKAKPAPAPLPAITAVKSSRTYTPKAGESLDRVIAQTMADSPLKIEVLRQAFTSLNPQALVAGSTSRLRAGVQMDIPDHDQLLASLVAQTAGKKESATPAGHADTTANWSGPVAGARDDRRQWIRYP